MRQTQKKLVTFIKHVNLLDENNQFYIVCIENDLKDFVYYEALKRAKIKGILIETILQEGYVRYTLLDETETKIILKKGRKFKYGTFTVPISIRVPHDIKRTIMYEIDKILLKYEKDHKDKIDIIKKL